MKKTLQIIRRHRLEVLAERIVKMAIFAYRMHPHDLDLQIVVRQVG